MPNGVDKNFWRLVSTVAAYHARHKDWPSEARLAPWAIWSLAQLLDAENFELLASRLPLRTTLRASFSAGSSRGHVVYDKIERSPSSDELDAAERWLGVAIRPEYRHAE